MGHQGMPKPEDMFYDETPRMRFKFLMEISNRSFPLEFNFTELLDGDADYNKAKIKAMEEQAQASMHGALQRLRAQDPDCEFVRWWIEDETGAIVKQSNILTITVKPQVGSNRGN